MKIIRKCKDCGWYNISNPTNYTHRGGAFCAKTCKKLTCVEIIPDWCPLEDVPEQAALDLVKKQTYELSVLRSGLERLRHDNDWHGVDEVNSFLDRLLAVQNE